MSGGRLAILRRSSGDVSPVRNPTEGATNDPPTRWAASSMPRIGLRRFFSMSTAKARRGDRYTTRVPPASRLGADPMRSMAQRNAARVLPDPVGAHNNVCSPAAIDGQARACANVGSGKAASNQARTGGENGTGATPWASRPLDVGTDRRADTEGDEARECGDQHLPQAGQHHRSLGKPRQQPADHC